MSRGTTARDARSPHGLNDPLRNNHAYSKPLSRVNERHGDFAATLASYFFGAKTGNAPSSFVSCCGMACGSNAGVTKILRTHLLSVGLGPALPALQGAETAVQ